MTEIAPVTSNTIDNESETQKLITKGKYGEESFRNWIENASMRYLYINQDTENFPTLFDKSAKRPDFLLLIESIGIIAVDVKNKTISDETVTLDMESELQKILNFERSFRISVWYAYMKEEGERITWHWISALKAIEVGEIREDKKKKKFVAIKLSDCVKIEHSNDISKLYQLRVPTMTRIGLIA